MTIQVFTIKYDAENRRKVFSRGDTITGIIMLKVSAKTEIKRLSVKAKGKANVLWEEDGQHSILTYHEYFSIKKCILQEGNGANVLTPGRHVHPFSFQIPDKDMPSSFMGKYGQILYSLEATLTRPMRFATKAKTDFIFVSKADLSMIQYLMKPQHGIKDKDVMFFASGKISMSIRTERQGYQQGEDLKVRAIIVNNSTRSVTPKYHLYEKQCFYAQRKRKVHTHNILKEKGDRIPAGTQQSVIQVLTIPPKLPATIYNCTILKLEYRLKVVLDVKLAIDLEIKLPIVVLTATPTLGQEPPPYSSLGFESQVPTASEPPPPYEMFASSSNVYGNL